MTKDLHGRPNTMCSRCGHFESVHDGVAARLTSGQIYEENGCTVCRMLRIPYEQVC